MSREHLVCKCRSRSVFGRHSDTEDTHSYHIPSKNMTLFQTPSSVKLLTVLVAWNLLDQWKKRLASQFDTDQELFRIRKPTQTTKTSMLLLHLHLCY